MTEHPIAPILRALSKDRGASRNLTQVVTRRAGDMILAGEA